MKGKRILAAALSSALLLCAGCGGQAAQEEQAPLGTAVEVVEAVTGEMSAEHALTGKVAAASAVQIFPMLAGQVQTLSVAEGDTVSKGQVLFTVDTSAVTSTMGALQQSYNATKTATDQAIANARITLEQAQLAVDNVRALYEAGAAAAQDVTRAEQGLQQAQSGLDAAIAQQTASLAQIQASMTQITTQADLGTVKAPCAGLVTMVNLVRGGMAAQSQPAVIIAEDGKIEVEVSVAEDVFTNIRAGDAADISLSVLGSEPVRGTIAALPVAANMQTGLYDVSVSLPAGARPPIGAFATVTFYTNRRTALHVPTEAVLTGEGDEKHVFVVREDKAVRVAVETGLVGRSDTEIVSGLNEGDRVVVKGQSYLADGDPVRVVTGTAGTAPAAADAAQGGEG